jgi:betaine-aldehyde dehydrogenase
VPQLFIDGVWQSALSGDTDEVCNPADATVLTRVDRAGPAEVAAAVAAAQRSFRDGRWRSQTPAARGALLNRVADLLDRDREELARTETCDTGKTLREARQDVDDSVATFRYYAELVTQPLTRHVATTAAHVHSRIEYEPIGVCALITPWNYPLLQVSWKLAPALAAGNSVVVKPSEVTPLSTVRLIELLAEAGLPAGVANLLLGAGVHAGAPLCAHPDVDLISFTGGLQTGRKIMVAAAENMTKVALELGGKNPHIIFADADVDLAVDYALTGAFVHSGQVCSAGARLIVQDSCYERFSAELARRAERIKLGPGLDPGVECGPLVSAAQRDKVEGYVALGQAEGATLLAGGHRPEEAELARGYFYRPTLFGDCHRGMRVVQEEMFGPIATLERFHTADEAVVLGNDTRYGLAGGVFSADADRAREVAAQLRHGTVWINDFGPYLPQAEWGGFKQSGIGRELGPSGLLEYYEAKHVYENLRPQPLGWFAG